jgi:Ni,Fe-hydrogenase III large subunit
MVGELGGSLMSLFATDERDSAGPFLLHQVWSLRALRTFLHVTAPVDPAAPLYPSIAAKHPVANWFEREVMDFFGLVPDGHPNPVRVALHDDWPDGAWPLRKDFPADGMVPRVEGESHPFRPVTGEGVFQGPVDPCTPASSSPDTSVSASPGPVLYLQLRLFYVHKGTEKRFERLPWRHGLFLAESISGDTAVGHALCYAHAIERLAGINVPLRARALRVVLLELERLYNHVADIGALATDVAFTVPASRAQALREELVRLQDRLFGTRLLRGTIALGGVRHDLPRQGQDVLRAHLSVFEKQFGDLIRLLIDAGTFTDRVDATGILTNQAARDLGIVGMAARASGVDADFRRDHPPAAGGLRFEVPVEAGGDVRARLMIRAREVSSRSRSSARCSTSCPTRRLRRAPDQLPARSSALGWASVARSDHPLDRDRQPGRLARVKVTDRLSQLAGARARGAGQHHSRLPRDQQELQSLVFGQRSIGDDMLNIITKSLKTGVLTEADPFGTQASFGSRSSTSAGARRLRRLCAGLSDGRHRGSRPARARNATLSCGSMHPMPGLCDRMRRGRGQRVERT